MVAARQIDLISMLHRLTLPYDSHLFAYALLCQSSAKDLVLQFSVAKPKNTSDMTPVLPPIGPGIKLLAFGMNHIGVLGDDAKK